MTINSKYMKPNVFPPEKTTLISGVNDLLTKFPNIANELISSDPSEILFSSVKKEIWKCSLCSDEWTAPPKSRVTVLMPKVGCPSCSRKSALISRRSKKLLKDVYPDLASQLVDTSLLNSITYGSHIDVMWICNYDHQYKMSVNKRVNGRGCPYCSFRSLLIGFNNLGSVRPDLVDELINSDDAYRFANDKTKIDWHHFTDDGIEHFWSCSVISRVYNAVNCAICSSKQVQIGVNDFKSCFLDKSNYEWGNNDFSPESISFGSSKIVEIVCNNHKQPNIMRMAAKFFSKGTRVCQDCKSNSEKFISKGEREIADLLIKNFGKDKVEQTVRRFKGCGVYEIDILYDNKIAIDFDGTYWHQEGVFKPIGYHKNKRAAIEKLGFKFLTIDEKDWLMDKEQVKTDIIQYISQHM